MVFESTGWPVSPYPSICYYVIVSYACIINFFLVFFKENMADESPFTLEECIVTSTWVHEHNNTGDTLDTISGKFRERFNKNPPT